MYSFKNTKVIGTESNDIQTNQKSDLFHSMNHRESIQINSHLRWQSQLLDVSFRNLQLYMESASLRIRLKF